MTPTVRDILAIIETMAPAKLAEPWDNTGLMIGSPGEKVTTILIGLDPTTELLEEAEARGANLLITHHPVIFHPLKSIDPDRPEGKFIARALDQRINVISCHTNLDSALHGVSEILARRLGLTETAPLARQKNSDAGCGLGRIGTFPAPISAPEFIRRLKAACNPPWILGAGARPEQISRAAVCGGSCSELADTALRAGAQVFVTAEVKHHVARLAEQTGMWIIDAGHFATENSALLDFAERLQAEASARFGSMHVGVSARQTGPLTLLNGSN
ncbi:MAG TPA: Nif3-like dinuclear metal center hexameric protein [Desulfobacteraceae bacterium]|nr:Nif3-like dinuclear metal center hexameric protein [Desulfobacteraceae bacterium]